MARSKTLRSLCGPSVLAPVLSVQRRNVVDGLVLQIEMVSSLNYLYYGANAGSSLILTQGLKHAPFSNSFYLQITRNANWLATWRPGPASTGVPGLCSVPHSQPPPLRPCGLYVLLRPRLGREGTRLALALALRQRGRRQRAWRVGRAALQRGSPRRALGGLGRESSGQCGR